MRPRPGAAAIQRVEDLTSTMLHYSGVKHSEKDLEFSVVPHDRVLAAIKSPAVFLEKGNPNAGLLHIIMRHFNDFAVKGFGVNDIVGVLKHAIQSLSPLDVTPDARGVTINYAFDDRLYPHLKHDVLKVAIGFNGFIVTAHPSGVGGEMGKLRGIADSGEKLGEGGY